MITLAYRIPQNNKKQSVQQSRLLAVSLQEGVTNNELTLLGITENGRAVVPIVGPPPEWELRITYIEGPNFASQFTTAEAKLSAVRNLWTDRISLQLGVLVTAADPVIV